MTPSEGNVVTDFYENLANELAAVAEAIRGLAGQGLPESWVQLAFQPGRGVVGDDTAIHAVDTIAQALIGKPGTTELMSGGSYHHTADGTHGRVLNVAVYKRVESPEKRALEAELVRLRAEVEAARRHSD